MSFQPAADGLGKTLDYRHGIPINPDPAEAEAALKARLSRKRTKTGCLTCRKRRIKCGEEREVCKNCIKSKRNCEGYSQRVIFRQSSIDHTNPPNGGGAPIFQSGRRTEPVFSFGASHGRNTTFYPQSRPDAYSQYAPVPPPVILPYPTAEQLESTSAIPSYPSLSSLPHDAYPVVEPRMFHPPATDAIASSYTVNRQEPSYLYSAPASFSAQVGEYPPQRMPTPRQSQTQAAVERRQRRTAENGHWSDTSPTTSVTLDQISPSSTLSGGVLSWQPSSASEVHPHLWKSSQYALGPGISDLSEPQTRAVLPPLTQALAPLPIATAPAVPHVDDSLFDIEAHHQALPPYHTTDSLLSSAAIEMQDDDYYDIKSDEEMDIDPLTMTTLSHERQRNLHEILQINNIGVQDLHARRYDTFIYQGILDHYRVEDAANPLKNPATARVFAHFIAVTGPCLSVFERHPRNTSVLFTEGHVPFSQQGLWTYTMPVAALHNQGLLHSMLALASLHIARLQDASDTPSRQHYAWACKRINKLLSKPKRRHKTTTIAASMLLGFYEIFTADHRAWNLHLKGSGQLFLETDFTSLARKFRQKKRERAARPPINGYDELPSSYSQTHDEILDQTHDVDDAAVSRLVGSKVSYDDPNSTDASYPSLLYDFDLSNFEILKDLYWWYLKQDAYQSIISGNPLL